MERAALAQGLEQLSSNQEVGSSISVFPSPRAEVSLGKILNPKLPLSIEKVLYRCTVCVWMDECKTEL